MKRCVVSSSRSLCAIFYGARVRNVRGYELPSLLIEEFVTLLPQAVREIVSEELKAPLSIGLQSNRRAWVNALRDGAELALPLKTARRILFEAKNKREPTPEGEMRQSGTTVIVAGDDEEDLRSKLGSVFFADPIQQTPFVVDRIEAIAGRQDDVVARFEELSGEQIAAAVVKFVRGYGSNDSIYDRIVAVGISKVIEQVLKLSAPTVRTGNVSYVRRHEPVDFAVIEMPEIDVECDEGHELLDGLDRRLRDTCEQVGHLEMPVDVKEIHISRVTAGLCSHDFDFRTQTVNGYVAVGNNSDMTLYSHPDFSRTTDDGLRPSSVAMNYYKNRVSSEDK